MGKKFSFDFIPLTTDQIKEMASSEISFNISKFRRFIREAFNAGIDAKPYETEFCYLDHERQRREKAEKANRTTNNYFRSA